MVSDLLFRTYSMKMALKATTRDLCFYLPATLYSTVLKLTLFCNSLHLHVHGPMQSKI